jgi:hypothetical protein
MFKITIETDNDVFSGEAIGSEVAHILRNLADRIEEQSRAFLAQTDLSFNVRDSNGNTVGGAAFSDIGPGDEDEDQDEDEDEDEDQDQDEDDDPHVTCPACHGPTTSLGVLGDRWHLSCRDCGAEFSHEV